MFLSQERKDIYERKKITWTIVCSNLYRNHIFYDGNNHVIPETIGNWTTMDDNGLHLEVGSEDSRGRRTPIAKYQYDDRGNLTDYWYMYTGGNYQRHVVYQYDSQDHLIREHLYYTRSNALLSYNEYMYDDQGRLTRKNQVDDAKHPDDGGYILYYYDEEGRLIREEEISGGCTHDYVDYYYNDQGELIREYHFLEDKMMGGPYTVEYLFEAVDDSAG